MIKLTLTNGSKWYVNPDQIIAVNYHEEYKNTSVWFGGDGYCVTESPEEVVRKVLEYRLAMARHMAASQAAYFHRAKTENPYTPPLENWNELEKLPGLEAKSQ
ncbi:flagellar FlbD family protein [Paenibacillus tyrfis]|uniref:flagellar FlbD family protein n=1 Tax=Paenibacillus tyrfis TaxID=1501230 RepID=UPI0020A1997B|nr:flagellar FlbD family protein [Paenibacillus tyrfis]MCP1306421.1 flagellar FlbD family protein [Paenibacillus tyrfis]